MELTTRQRRGHALNDTIDGNTCCACFGNYEDDFRTGREWLQCCCSIWIREECVEQYRTPPQISTYACRDNGETLRLKLRCTCY